MEIQEPRRHKVRVAAALGAVAAAGVAALFATVGDGVDAQASGPRGTLLDHGHTAVWVLLTAALATTAVDRGPRPLPRILGYAALATYAAFLTALIFGNG